MINVRAKIEEIVLSVKSSGGLVSFTDNLDGTYTIEAADIGNLAADFKVVLIYSDESNNKDIVISSVDSDLNTFTFSGTNITEPDSWEMAIYFEHGHRIELNKKYTNKAKSINKQVQEYPLIWLYTDFEKNITDTENVEFETTLQLAIVDFSNKELYEEQRIDQKFEPVLWPLLELINDAFNKTTYKRNFVTPYGTNKDIDFLQVERPFFGSDDQQANVLPQVTDAIEIQVDLSWRKSGATCTAY